MDKTEHLSLLSKTTDVPLHPATPHTLVSDGTEAPAGTDGEFIFGQ
jgi:hypothetical protein